MPELVIADLLKPIPGANPAGEDLRYSATYEKIKEARREDDGLAQGAWQRERKIADYKLVIELTRQALAAKSKDLQVAAWLTEALVRQEGFTGLKQGLTLCAGLLERFWDHVYPMPEDGDAELRAAPLAWIGTRLDTVVKAVPLAKAGYDWFAYRQSRDLGYENPAATPEQKKAREKILKEGKLAPEVFDKAFAETPRSYYEQADTSLNAALAALEGLDEICGAKFGEASPPFGKLRQATEEVRHTVHVLLEKKGKPEPEPKEAVAKPEQLASATTEEAAGAPAAAAPDPAPRCTIDSFEQASEALKAGRQQHALQILNRDLATQPSGRGRFLRKLQLARLCIAAGKDLIAQPLLDDLAAAIDNHKLDEWEEHETVAAALVTILLSSKRIQADAKEKQKFFDRICRLDASQALGC
jgi:type VI secretion system protein ImpA